MAFFSLKMKSKRNKKKNKSKSKPKEKSKSKPKEKSKSKPKEKIQSQPKDKNELKPREKDELKPKEKSESKSKENSEPLEKSKLKPMNFAPSTLVYDCCALIIHCRTHNNVLISCEKNNEWMPFISLMPNKGWDDNAVFGFLFVISDGNMEKMEAFKNELPCTHYKSLQIFRLQLPRTKKFINRLIYYFSVKNNEQFTCCKKVSSKLKWMPFNEIKKGNLPNAWGPELVEFCSLEKQKTKISEFSLEEAFLYVPRDPPRNLEEALLKALRITEKDIERLYGNFLKHCYPSFYMTIKSFTSYMNKHEFDHSDRINRLFRAFNYLSNGYISFHEFLLGLACMEPNIIHGKLRVKFIFRFYSNDLKHLTIENLRAILTDMKVDETAISSKIEKALEAIGKDNLVEENNQKLIPEDKFMRIVGAHKFRGTSCLCRSKKGIFSEISRALAEKESKNVLQNLGDVLFKRKYQGSCKSCKNKKYNIATNMVLFDSNSEWHPKKLNLKNLDEKTNSKSNKKKKKKLNDEKNTLAQIIGENYSSEIVFNRQSAANILLQMVREFNKDKGTVRKPKGMMQNHKDDFWKLLLQIHNEIIPLIENEEKCHKVDSPCFVMGDIHGNIEDLLSLELCVWKQIPCVAANFLFLGDYVDRGQWGLECSLYLFAFKILCPNNVTLLRGNHETRKMQDKYSYKHECLIKYGEDYGLKVWEITNRVFDKLPVCASIDNSIFCAHGGLSRSAKKIDDIRQIQKDVKDPPKESTIVNEILWADPCHMQRYLEIVETLELDPQKLGGFVKNIKRGTSYFFNEEAAQNFFKRNGLSKIIRAHEVPDLGYMFHFGNLCATIFSSSHYCGNDNACSCILSDLHYLRVIILDTVNNISATD